MNILQGNFIRLRKALYGLKQVARQWNEDVNTYILSIGFTRLVTDSCMNIRGSYELDTLAIIVLYVDDMGIAGQIMKLVNKIKNKFVLKQSMKDLGKPQKMLGMQFKYSLNRISICNPQYISKIYHTYEIWLTT